MIKQRTLIGIATVIVILIIIGFFAGWFTKWFPSFTYNSKRYANDNLNGEKAPSKGPTGGGTTPPYVIKCNPERPGYDIYGVPRKECGKNPIQPPSSPCAEIKKQIDDTKVQMTMTSNSVQLSQLQNKLNNLNQQYINSGCVSPPPNPNSQV